MDFGSGIFYVIYFFSIRSTIACIWSRKPNHQCTLDHHWVSISLRDRPLWQTTEKPLPFVSNHHISWVSTSRSSSVNHIKIINTQTSTKKTISYPGLTFGSNTHCNTRFYRVEKTSQMVTFEPMWRFLQYKGWKVKKESQRV
jgi:hypothetical protein